jgi:hypothetical protein
MIGTTGGGTGTKKRRIKDEILSNSPVGLALSMVQWEKNLGWLELELDPWDVALGRWELELGRWEVALGWWALELGRWELELKQQLQSWRNDRHHGPES